MVVVLSVFFWKATNNSIYYFLAKIGTKVTEVKTGHLALGPPHSTQVAQVDGPHLRDIIHDNDAWF